MVHLYNATPLGSKKEQTVSAHNNVDEYQMDYIKKKKPDSKGYILNDSNSMTFWERQTYNDIKLISGCRGLKVGGKQEGNCGVNGIFLYLDFGNGYMTVCIYQNSWNYI